MKVEAILAYLVMPVMYSLHVSPYFHEHVLQIISDSIKSVTLEGYLNVWVILGWGLARYVAYTSFTDDQMTIPNIFNV